MIKEETFSNLSYSDQLLLTIFNKQVNDRGRWYKGIALRSGYDLVKLAEKVDSLEVIREFGHYFAMNNNFLASTRLIFNDSNIKCEDTPASKKFIQKQLEFIENPEAYSQNLKKWNLLFVIRTKLRFITLLFYDKRAWKYLFQRTKK